MTVFPFGYQDMAATMHIIKTFGVGSHVVNVLKASQHITILDSILIEQFMNE